MRAQRYGFAPSSKATRYIPAKGKKYIENIKTKFAMALPKKLSTKVRKRILATLPPDAILASPSPNRDSHW